MPAATTHVEFSKDVLSLLPTKRKEKITNLPMFYLGSQGPDMLFFSRASLLPGSLKKYGNLMHDIKVPEVILFFDQYAGKDADLYSYIQGYLCHYALDCFAHPLINAVARYNHKKTGIHEGESHVTSEANIDVWLLNQRGRSIQDYDVYNDLKVDAPARKKLAKMYHAMFKEVFDLDITEKRVDESIRHIASFTKVLSPSKAMLKFAYTAENLLKIPHSFSGMILMDKNNFEVLNLEHKAYPLAYDESQTIQASFPDLYGKALFYAKNIIEHHTYDTFVLNFNGVPKKIADQAIS